MPFRAKGPAAHRLEKLLKQTVNREISDEDRIVIFSDLHLGDGSANDDFKKNAKAFLYVLKHYYFEKDYTLVLNGDIEELLRFDLKKIKQQWKDVYQLLHQFNDQGRLLKIYGNHDHYTELPRGEFPLQESLCFHYKGSRILLFHGHQGGYLNSGRYNGIIKFILKRLANTLHIRNYTAAYHSRRIKQLERRIYNFSREKGIISVIGHSHRPLFATLSKKEDQIFRFFRLEEQLDYFMKSGNYSKARKIRSTMIKVYRTIKNMSYGDAFTSDPFNGLVPMPYLFNSGSVISKKGFTCLEIKKGKIALIHWLDSYTNRKFEEYNEYKDPKQIGSHYYRYIIKRDPLRKLLQRLSLIKEAEEKAEKEI